MLSKTIQRSIILVLVVAVASGLVFGAWSLQFAKLDSSLTARAKEEADRGDFENAAEHLQEHLRLEPKDEKAMAWLAEVLLKDKKDIRRQIQGVELYEGILRKSPGDNEIRSKLAEELVAREIYERSRKEDRPRDLLEILLKQEPDDGHLHFLLGKCQEHDGDHKRAVDSYHNAITHNAPDRLEAYRRAAHLLRFELKKPQEADQLINVMVQSAANDHRAYVLRGQYYLEVARTATDPASKEASRKAAKSDFAQALKQMPTDSSIYVHLADLSLSAGKIEEARKVLEDGLKAVPLESSVKLHLSLARIETQAGSKEKAIKSLRESLKLLPDEPLLHRDLAELLADSGATTELLVQIEELKRLNDPGPDVQYLEARRQMNSRDWKNASQTLGGLLPLVESNPSWKIRINRFLSICYDHLGDLQRRDDARRRAFAADPNDLQARIAQATELHSRGEIDQAIDAYRKLVGQAPELRNPLFSLLLAKNLRRLPSDRDWSEVEQLIEIAKKQSPQSSEHIILRANLMRAQGKMADAQKLVDEARGRDPQKSELWLKSVELLTQQRRFVEAEKLLDQVPQSVNPVDVKFERLSLLLAQGGANLSAALSALAADSSSYPPADRRRLLEVLAWALTQLKDYSQAKQRWLDVAALDPTDIRPQLFLTDLAFQAGNEADIQQQIAKIKQMEAAEGPNGRFYEARYAIWKAEKENNPDDREQFCDRAKRLINELASRRADLPQIYVTLGQIDELQSRRAGLEDKDRKERQYNAALHYLRAFQLGQRDLEIVRRVTDLLYSSGHTKEIVQLWNQLATVASPGLQEKITRDLLGKREFDVARDLARRAIAADPDDFLKRIQLVQILLAQGRRDEAEIELREAVRAVPGDYQRRLTLVSFLAQVGQLQKAEESVRDAEPALKQASPLGLAILCDALGADYKTIGKDLKKSDEWYGKAEEWFKIAQNQKPDDSGVKRTHIDSLISSGRTKEAETALVEILEKPVAGDPRAAEEASWARRTLANLLIQPASDYQQVTRALTLVEPIAHAAKALGPGKPEDRSVSPQDLRVLAKVYEAQHTSEYHKKVRDVLEKLAAMKAVAPQDRYVLARFYSQDGDWSRAQEQYRLLRAQVESSRDPAVVKLLPEYLAQFALELIRHHQPGQGQQDLTTAQDLLEKLEQSPHDPMSILQLQAWLHKAGNHLDEARKLITSEADKPGAAETMMVGLARLAKELDQNDLAEEVLHKLVARSATIEHRLALIVLLGLNGKLKEGVDLCEGLWEDSHNPDVLATAVLYLFSAPGMKHDQIQLNRVTTLFQTALKSHPQSSNLMVGLGILRERQGLYREAEELYRQVVKQGGRNETALNNLAWLMALEKKNSKEALDFINRAIELKGPLSELLDTRGGVYLASGDYQSAIKDFGEAVAQDPTGPKYFHLAQAYLQAGNEEAAREALAKAKAKGLTEDPLHPLEVQAYRQILTKLVMR